jgi:hypothetical protein
MSFDLGSILGNAVGDTVKKIVGVFKADPTVVEQNKFELAKIEADLQARLQEAIAREVEAAGENIRAEAQSGDKFTSRARPTFLYVSNFIILWNFVVVPLFKQAPVAMPEPLFWLFGSVMLGYTGARTWEKVGGFTQK